MKCFWTSYAFSEEHWPFDHDNVHQQASAMNTDLSWSAHSYFNHSKSKKKTADIFVFQSEEVGFFLFLFLFCFVCFCKQKRVQLCQPLIHLKGQNTNLFCTEAVRDMTSMLKSSVLLFLLIESIRNGMEHKVNIPTAKTRRLLSQIKTHCGHFFCFRPGDNPGKPRLSALQGPCCGKHGSLYWVRFPVDLIKEKVSFKASYGSPGHRNKSWLLDRVSSVGHWGKKKIVPKVTHLADIWIWLIRNLRQMEIRKFNFGKKITSCKQKLQKQKWDQMSTHRHSSCFLPSISVSSRLKLTFGDWFTLQVLRKKSSLCGKKEKKAVFDRFYQLHGWPHDPLWTKEKKRKETNF